LSVAGALVVSLGHILRHSEPAVSLAVCIPYLAVAVTTGTACGEQDLVTL